MAADNQLDVILRIERDFSKPVLRLLLYGYLLQKRKLKKCY